MKKHYVLLSFLCFLISSVGLQARFNKEKLLLAINNINNRETKLLEKLLEESTISREDKERLLKIAKRNVRRCEDNMYLLRSGSDAFSFISGLVGAKCSFWALVYSLIGTGAAACANSNVAENKAMQIALVAAGASSTALVCSLYLIRKGWRCTAAQTILNEAEKVETLIEDISIEDISVVN